MKSISSRKNRWRTLLAVCLIASTSVTWGQAPTIPPTPAKTTPTETEPELFAKPVPLPIEYAVISVAPEQVFAQPASCETSQTLSGDCKTCQTSNGECENGCGSCCPRWTISAGAIFLTRGKGDRTVLARTATLDPNGTPLFNARDLEFDFETGFQVDITRHFDAFDLQGNFFHVGGWNSGRTAFGVANTFSVAAPGLLVSGVTLASGTYSSDLSSGELNMKPHTDSIFRPFTGFRWVQLDERFAGAHDAVTTGTLASAWEVDTRNDLYGLQFGLDMLLLNNSRVQLNAIGKVAIAANVARNRIRSFPGQGGGIMPTQIESNGGVSAFIYDMALKGTVQISEHVAFSGGYSVMILSQVALAPSQLEQNQIATGATTAPTAPLGSRELDTGDFLLVHGANVNLEITW